MQSKLWDEEQLTLHPPAHTKIQFFWKRKNISKMHLQLWEAIETFLLLDPSEDSLLMGGEPNWKVSIPQEGRRKLSEAWDPAPM